LIDFNLLLWEDAKICYAFIDHSVDISNLPNFKPFSFICWYGFNRRTCERI